MLRCPLVFFYTYCLGQSAYFSFISSLRWCIPDRLSYFLYLFPQSADWPWTLEPEAGLQTECLLLLRELLCVFLGMWLYTYLSFSHHLIADNCIFEWLGGPDEVAQVSLAMTALADTAQGYCNHTSALFSAHTCYASSSLGQCTSHLILQWPIRDQAHDYLYWSF